MKSQYFYVVSIILVVILNSCKNDNVMSTEIFETSAEGNKMTKIELSNIEKVDVAINILPENKFQTITGIGGSFTEASAHLVNQLSKANRDKILDAYFGDNGAKYSLTRTHINSSDFSLSNYSYDSIPGDTLLKSFSIEHDRNDIIPMIKDAQLISTDGFKIISSPWTAPPWMKDNNDWKGGKLLPEYYETWALYFSKYIEEYKKEGIDIWGLTFENEPLGNDNNWESMHYTPEEMTLFVSKFLGPKLKADNHNVIILGYDQNRNVEMNRWADVMYKDSISSEYFDGIAIHWYASTYDYFPDALQELHSKATEKHIIQTEACIDGQVPAWKDDDWYWSKEATDWGYYWAPEDQKYLHPKYIPTYRYAQDIIGCFNNWVDGWVDWNMVLNRQGGPNWAKNWCTAPVIVDTDSDEVYFTPLYYVMSHFSRFIRPGAKRIGFNIDNESVNITAVENTDGTIVVVIFNPYENDKGIELNLKGQSMQFMISAKAIQTVIIKNQK
jgi:glucosylceramidase